MCLPAGLNLAGARGLRARYEGAEEDGGHLGHLRLAERMSLLHHFGRGGRWRERGGRVGARRDRDDRGPGTCRARKSRVYGMWTVPGGSGSMHPLRYQYELLEKPYSTSREGQGRSHFLLVSGS